ncbi:chemotaxis protein CheW [Pseudokineococcus sp. 1T1Z-3]|uniref:chemotaxis protein CheW n=1 Tax=Pseudokineococcus sp. 1T1Z-3 TaxID=3132745 RepID=UPI0030ACCD7F
MRSEKGQSAKGTRGARGPGEGRRTGYVTFELAGGLYGIAVLDVQEVLTEQRRTRVPTAPPEVAGLVNLRGQVVTAIDLRLRLGLPPRPQGARSTDVVVRIGDEAVSLLVDGIGDVVEVEDDDLEPPPDGLSGPMADLVLGAHQLPDRLLLPLDAVRAASLDVSV